MKNIKSFIIAFFRPSFREIALLFTVSVVFIGFGFVSGGWLFWVLAGVFGMLCSRYKDSVDYEMPTYHLKNERFNSVISWGRVGIIAILITSFALASFCLFQKSEDDYWLRFCRHLSYGCFSFGGLFLLGFLELYMWSLLGVTERSVGYSVIESVTVIEFAKPRKFAFNQNS